MAVGWITMAQGLVEWLSIADGESPDHIAVPEQTEMSVQLMAVTGVPTVQVEWSLNRDEDGSKTWTLAKDSTGTAISLTAAGVTGALILESGMLVRPRITAGTTVTARVRIKFTNIR